MPLRAAFVAVALVAAGSTAPLQCGHTPEAELREDETPGDALWTMAQKFHDRRDVAAERATLECLVERYPASRWVSPAKDALGHLGAGGDAGG